MKLSTQTIALASILSLSPAVLAQDVDNRSNIYLGGVKYLFDTDHNQNNDIGYLVGFEVPVSERWSMAIEHWDIESDIKAGTGDSDVTYNRIGANYHWLQHEAWQPYTAIGLGHLDIEPSGAFPDSDDYAFDIGLGVKRYFSDNFLARGDAKAIYADSDIGTEFAISLSLAYVFGSKTAAVPVAAPEPVTLDSDGDGVINSSDRCPQTPTGRNVDATGCQLDADNDGVVDALDNCPNTAAELAVDRNGCPVMDASMMRQTLEVNFATNRAEIQSGYTNEIRDFADFMNQYSNTTAVIEGHTDSDGAESYNQSLSEKRAQAVMNELVSKYGINASRLSSVGYGEARPTATNSTRAGKAENRRIEAEVSVEVETQRQR